MLDIFESFFGDLTGIDASVIACLACALGIFVLDCIFRIIFMAFKAMLGVRS